MNQLQHETSPYLLQHKNNPVDWYPWKEEVLQKAQQEKVNISLIELENTNKQNKSELYKLLEEKTDLIRNRNSEFERKINHYIKN